MDYLPDPLHDITPDGQTDTGSGTYGPGFASVNVSSESNAIRDRSNSGRLISRLNSYHNWKVDIGYNPLSKAEFELLYSFLMQKQADLEPFLVVLPQYLNSAAGTKTINTAASARSRDITLDSVVGISVGDMCSISDTNDSLHTKAYKVTRISGNTITVSPPLQKDVGATGATLEFGEPEIRVIASDSSINYSLTSDGLYNLSLKLEEAYR